MSIPLLRRHSDFPLPVKEAVDRRHSWQAPTPLKQISENDSVSIRSATPPTKDRLITTTTRRRSRRVSQAIVAAINKRKARYASPSHWELKLIDDLLGDARDENFDFELPTRQSTEDSSQLPDSTVRDDTANAAAPVFGHDTIAEGTALKLQVHRISQRPSLRIMQAVQANEGEIVSATDTEGSSVMDKHPLITDLEAMDDCASIITFSPVPQLKLDNDWPLPYAEAPEFSPVSPLQSERSYSFIAQPTSKDLPSASSSVSSLASTHPHPLRSNPVDKVIDKAVRKVSSEVSLRSVASNKSNRVGFVMQKNDSSLSLHSQGTLTDMTTVLTPSDALYSSAIADYHPNMSVNRSSPSIASYRSLARPYLRRPRPLANRSGLQRRLSIASAMLSPVTELAERKDSRKDSASVMEGRRPSGLGALFGGDSRRFGSLKFSGAIVSQSRRSARLQKS